MDQVFKLSELNQFIKDVLNSAFPASVWVTGEIQNYNRSKMKRHIFFELVEKKEDSNDVTARANLVIFERQKPHIQSILKQSENAFELKDDIEVKFLCRVDFYGPHGSIRLAVESIDPVYTLGKMAQDRQKLIADLSKRGVLDKNKSLALPKVPLKLGLITSDDSAAYNDFLNELKSSALAFQVFMVNSIMQGKNCEASVVKAVKVLNTYDLDVIVITRGGGSIADLSCFDSKLIAEAIAESSYPVITGIGHEINTSVTDLAAHTYCITPTATAQFLIERVGEFLEQLDEFAHQIQQLSQDHIQEQKQHLKELAMQIQQGTQQSVKFQHERIVRLSENIRQLPSQKLSEQKESLDDSFFDIKQTIDLRISQAKTKISHYSRLVELASPKKILKRGFALVRDDEGKVVKSIAQIKKNDKITTEYMDGTSISVVESLKNGE